MYFFMFFYSLSLKYPNMFTYNQLVNTSEHKSHVCKKLLFEWPLQVLPFIFFLFLWNMTDQGVVQFGQLFL